VALGLAALPAFLAGLPRSSVAVFALEGRPPESGNHGRAACSDPACSDPACSDPACSDPARLGHSDVARSRRSARLSGSATEPLESRPARQSSAVALPAMLLARLVTIVGIAALCFGAAFSSCFRRGPGVLQPGVSAVCERWIFSRIVAARFAWLGFRASTCYARNSDRKLQRAALFGATAAINICIFLFAPVYCPFRAQIRSQPVASHHRFAPQIQPGRDHDRWLRFAFHGIPPFG
jgi:hypothetical protein